MSLNPSDPRSPLGWTHILITGDESDDPKAANVAPRSGIRPFLEKPKVVAKTPTSRVDKLLSSMGYGSRKEMARMAKAGGITLDGADLLDVTKRIPVTPDLPTRMQIDGEALDPVAGLVILLNKPLGMTCSHKEDGALVYDILPDRWRRRDPAISTIGRLDKQTSGLLLLTDDGDLLHRVISPKRHVKKTYRAKLARPLNGTEAALFASGQLMLEGEDKPLTSCRTGNGLRNRSPAECDRGPIPSGAPHVCGHRQPCRGTAPRTSGRSVAA